MENINLDAELLLNERKATQGMRESLAKLRSFLLCPLCHKLFEMPTTLSSCAHSFCAKCIDSYCCDASICPVPGCGMPTSLTGGHKGSYRKVNPQLLQTVTSLNTICRSLNRAPDFWWSISSDKQQSTIVRGGGPNQKMDTATEEEPSAAAQPMIDLQNNYEEQEMVDLQQDDEMIDLQQHESFSDDDDDDDESEWES